MESKAFEIVSSQIEAYVGKKDFTVQPVQNKDNTRLEKLYTSQDKAIRLTYNKDTRTFNLEHSSIIDGEIDNSWKGIAAWLFDASQHDERDAKTIAADFEDALAEMFEKPKRPLSVMERAQAAREAAQSTKGKAGSDPKSFVNLLVNDFPQLREPLKAHIDQYGQLLADTFIVQYINPSIKKLLSTGKSEKKIKKLFALIEDKFINGSDEIKSIIVATILCSLEKNTPERELAKKHLSPFLIKEWSAYEKYALKNK